MFIFGYIYVNCNYNLIDYTRFKQKVWSCFQQITCLSTLGSNRDTKPVCEIKKHVKKQMLTYLDPCIACGTKEKRNVKAATLTIYTVAYSE